MPHEHPADHDPGVRDALRRVYDRLYLDMDRSGREFYNLEKEWDLDDLEAIADIVRPLAGVLGVPPPDARVMVRRDDVHLLDAGGPS